MVDVERGLDLSSLDVYDFAVVLTNYAEEVFLHLHMLDAVYSILEDFLNPN